MKKRNLVLSVMTTFYYRDVTDKNKLIVKL